MILRQFHSGLCKHVFCRGRDDGPGGEENVRSLPHQRQRLRLRDQAAGIGHCAAPGRLDRRRCVLGRLCRLRLRQGSLPGGGLHTKHLQRLRIALQKLVERRAALARKFPKGEGILQQQRLDPVEQGMDHRAGHLVPDAPLSNVRQLRDIQMRDEDPVVAEDISVGPIVLDIQQHDVPPIAFRYVLSGSAHHQDLGQALCLRVRAFALSQGRKHLTSYLFHDLFHFPFFHTLTWPFAGGR